MRKADLYIMADVNLRLNEGGVWEAPTRQLTYYSHACYAWLPEVLPVVVQYGQFNHGDQVGCIDDRGRRERPQLPSANCSLSAFLGVTASNP